MIGYPNYLFLFMMKPIFLGVIGLVLGYSAVYVYGNVESNDVIGRMAITLLVGLYLGMLFIVYVLPRIADGVTGVIYSDPGGVADDPTHDARALVAQGKYEEAERAYRAAIPADEHNRLPWVEMAKIRVQHLEDANGAVAILSEALESTEWRVNDKAYFMFRISEIHLEDCDDKDSAISVLKEVQNVFPETRHSANATHQLRELGAI